MDNEKIDKIVASDPSKQWLKQIAENGIVVVSPNVEKYKNDPNQIELSGYSGEKTISQQFLVDIITNNYTYKKIKQLYETRGYSIYVLFIDEKGEYKDQYGLGRLKIINLLQKIDVSMFPAIKNRYEELMDYVSFEKFREKTQNDNYEITIDGVDYKTPVSLFYQYLDINDVSLEVLAQNDKNNHLPRFLYTLNKFFEDNKIEEEYIISDEMKSRLEEIRSSKIVDIQFFNEYNETNDPLLTKINVNAELKDFILKGMDSNFTDLEKAIYIFIKMCKALTYDNEFFAVNQEGPLAKKHKTVDYIASISLLNNKVVCSEFNAIYAHMLHEFGINYKNFVSTVNGNGDHDEDEFDEDFNRYGEGHLFLKFRCGKYLVKADSVTSILQGDLMQAKLNQPLRGLVCENVNKQSQKEFKTIVDKVYNYIAQRESKITKNEPQQVETFEDIVSQFVDMSDKVKPIDINDKIDILIKKVNSTRMVGIDAYSYLLQLRKILFSKEEQKDNIKISIIRNFYGDAAEALAIISTRTPDEAGKMVIKRYMFRPRMALIPVAIENLQENFDNGTMAYIKDDDAPKIPGIKR